MFLCCCPAGASQSTPTPSATALIFVNDLGDVETCLTTPNVGWIAATGPGQMQDLALRRLVRDYCFDYVTMPCDRER
ncbi:VpsR-related response regulator, partial [Burkholderia gladioli]|nr:VpsR-related response regulator [Burkholderia gladioli]